MLVDSERNLRGRPAKTTRAEVVDAGLEILRTEGLDAVTLAAVAQRLGLGKVAMYTYVASKDDLLLAMRDEINRRQVSALDEDSSLSPEAALKAACARLVDLMRDYGKLLAVVGPDLTGPGLEAGERFLELLAALGLRPADQLHVYVLLAGFLTTFAGGGIMQTDAVPQVEESLAQDAEHFPRTKAVLHDALPATSEPLVEDVMAMVIDVLIPALRDRAQSRPRT